MLLLIGVWWLTNRGRYSAVTPHQQTVPTCPAGKYYSATDDACVEAIIYGCLASVGTLQTWRGCYVLATPPTPRRDDRSPQAGTTMGPCLIDERDGNLPSGQIS